MENKKRYVAILLNILIPVAEILLVCLLGPKLLKFFMPFVIGWIIAMIANPLVRFLESRLRIVRRHSSALIVVLVLAAVIGLGYFLISRLLWQAFELAKDLPDLYVAASEELREISARFDDVFRMLPVSVQDAWNNLAGNVGQSMSVLVQKIASPTVAIRSSSSGGGIFRMEGAGITVI